MRISLTNAGTGYSSPPTVSISGGGSGAGAGGYVLSDIGAPLNSGTTYHLTDAYNTSDDIFGGGEKYDDNPNSWNWVVGSANDKTDMNNAFIHLSTDSKILRCF